MTTSIKKSLTNQIETYIRILELIHMLSRSCFNKKFFRFDTLNYEIVLIEIKSIEKKTIKNVLNNQHV